MIAWLARLKSDLLVCILTNKYVLTVVDGVLNG